MLIFACVFAVLDIESSGGPFGKEAIIEIAVFRYDGDEVTDQLISLVHPHREVQKYVSKMTGITPKMLMRAPRFHEIAKRLIEITEGAVLVGHNVDFDYRMLRQEFARLGYVYEREALDTIKLAEELIPDLPSYGLDKVCDELGIFRTNKHRAESDARATLELFKILKEKDQRKSISIMGQSIQEADYQKEKVNDLIRSVKNNKGIFYLHDKDGDLLYIGASDNIKSALSRVFIADSKRAEELREKVTSVKSEAVGNWLVSRIKKTEELLSAKPPYNRSREVHLDIGIYADMRPKVPRLFQEDLAKAGKKKPLLKTLNRKMAGRALRMYGRNFQDEKSRIEILSYLKDFPAEGIFQGSGRKNSERCAFVVRNHQLAGYYYFSLNDQVNHASRLEKSMTPVPHGEQLTELLKLGVLSGEFREMKTEPAEKD